MTKVCQPECEGAVGKRVPNYLKSGILEPKWPKFLARFAMVCGLNIRMLMMWINCELPVDTLLLSHGRKILNEGLKSFVACAFVIIDYFLRLLQ